LLVELWLYDPGAAADYPAPRKATRRPRSLKIQISLEMDSPQPDEQRLKALRHELSDVESQVGTHQ